MSQRMTLITAPCFVPEVRLDKIDNLQELFDAPRPLSLEIGCGVGDFIVQLADRHPDQNFIAIDIFNRGCKQTCNRIEDAGLSNIRILRTEARSLLLRHTKERNLRAIYINCPDPWPKKRHRKRRMINADFLRIALWCLEEDGHFHFSTDFVDYGVEVGELLSGMPGFVSQHPTPHTHDLGDYPVSKYMRRFLKLGQPLYYCHYRRQPGFQVPPPPEPKKGFRLRWAEQQA